MTSKIEKLDKEVTEMNEKLVNLVENGEEWDKVYRQSMIIDKVMVRYLDEKKKLNDTQKELMKKNYDKLQLADKDEIINQIKEDVKKEFPEVKEKDLTYFSTNLYIYATLTALGAEKQDIIDQLMFVNNRYIEMHIEDAKRDIAVTNNNNNSESNDSITNADLNYLRNLNKKYTKIIKEKI